MVVVRPIGWERVTFPVPAFNVSASVPAWPLRRLLKTIFPLPDELFNRVVKLTGAALSAKPWLVRVKDPPFVVVTDPARGPVVKLLQTKRIPVGVLVL